MEFGKMSTPELDALGRELMEKTQQYAKLRAAIPPQAVEDHTFQTPEGDRKLSELFGDKSDLILVHNMGRGCPYCTLWADGLNAFTAYLTDRTNFVVSSPDTPEVQQEFAKERGWKFQMVSFHGTQFAHDHGFAEENAEGKTLYLPGATTFKKDADGTMYRVAQSPFGPGDSFCGLWPLLDMLPGGPGNWEPRFLL